MLAISEPYYSQICLDWPDQGVAVHLNSQSPTVMSEASESPQLVRPGFIHDYLVLPKLLFLSLNMTVYSTYYFTSNYFKTVWNIPIDDYGVMQVLTGIGFFGSIFWTMLADRTKRHKVILLSAVLGFCATFCLLRLELFNADVFWRKILFVSIVTSIATFFTSALYPLLDNRVFALLSATPNFNTQMYGQQRLWGTVGQAFITQVNAFGIRSWLGYDTIFISLVISTLIFVVLVAVSIPRDASEPEVQKEISTIPVKEETEKSSWQPMRALISSPQFMFFLFLAFSAGYVRSVLGHFLPYFFEFQVTLSQPVYNAALQTKIISEIAFYFMGKPLMDKLGVFWVMMIGQLTGLIRVFGYAIVPPTPKWSFVAFFLEFLKGVNNACIVIAGVHIAHGLAPATTEATAQGFFSGVQASLGNASAGFIGGMILKFYRYDPLRFNKLFMHTSIFSAITCLAYAIQHFFKPFPVDRG